MAKRIKQKKQPLAVVQVTPADVDQLICGVIQNTLLRARAVEYGLESCTSDTITEDCLNRAYYWIVNSGETHDRHCEIDDYLKKKNLSTELCTTNEVESCKTIKKKNSITIQEKTTKSCEPNCLVINDKSN